MYLLKDCILLLQVKITYLLTFPYGVNNGMKAVLSAIQKYKTKRNFDTIVVFKTVYPSLFLSRKNSE